MGTSMPPPPPRPPKSSLSISHDPSATCSSSTNGSTAVPASLLDSLHKEGADVDAAVMQTTGNIAAAEQQEQQHEEHLSSSEFLYSVPSWSASPMYPFSLEVIKDGQIVENLNVSAKGAFMFGRSDRCDFMLEHLSISRYHAVLQFKRNGDAFVFDLGSTHGTFINKRKVVGKTYIPLHVGDVFKFGLSSRLYVLQGPTDLMPKDALKVDKPFLEAVDAISDQADKEASLVRARREAIQMDGASWGMVEDAVEEEIQEEDELTWQTYKGQLNDKQQKTLEKIQKRNEKISSLRREIDAIQVKEIPQGGLTQGQQTQVARNEQRIEQLMEELENLEETLNQSIQESVGARSRRSLRKGEEDEDDFSSDDDDFYDRTNRQNKKKTKTGPDAQVVETAESLLEKREKLMNEIRNLNTLLENDEKKCMENANLESQDALDAFMTSVSSTLGKDRVCILRKEIEKQQAELNRILFLLKIADPCGEAQGKWGTDPPVASQSEVAEVAVRSRELVDPIEGKVLGKPNKNNVVMSGNQDKPKKVKVEVQTNAPSITEGQGGMQSTVKGPIWLGQPREIPIEAEKPVEVEITSGKEFLEYRERSKLDSKSNEDGNPTDVIMEDAQGLILRKPKNPRLGNNGKDVNDDENEKALWDDAAAAAADKVAMLLRHQKGLGAIEEESQHETTYVGRKEVPKGSKKRKLGPGRPAFLDGEESEFPSWVPPKGQTGDGRTALNDKYGY